MFSKAVMHAIANWMNPLGEPCHVAMRQLADDVEISTRTAHRHVRRLEDMGLLVRSEAHCVVGGQGWSTFSFPGYVPEGLERGAACDGACAHPGT